MSGSSRAAATPGASTARSTTATTPVTAALLVLSLLLAGCATASGSGVPAAAGPARERPADLASVVPLPTPVPALPVTVRSDDGRDVTVTDVSRVVAVTLSGTLAEVVVSLGLGDRLVGRDIATTVAQVAHLPLVTRAHDVSAEGVLALSPTLLLVDASTGPPEAVGAVRAAGVPVVVVPEAWSLDEVYPRIDAVAAALGVPDAGEQLVERTRGQVEAALVTARAAVAETGRLRVGFLYLRGTAGVYLLGGRGSGADSLVEALGMEDAGAAIGLERFRPLTSEGLVRAAPDVLLLMDGGLESVGGVDGLLEVAGVAQTPAGRDRRVVSMPDGLLLSFGPRTGAVLRELADRLALAVAA